MKCVTGPVQTDYSHGLGTDIIPNKPEENAKAGANFMSDEAPDWKVMLLGSSASAGVSHNAL